METSKIYPTSVYFIRHDGDVLTATLIGELTDLVKDGIPILWENQGAYRLIAPSVLRNTASGIVTYRILRTQYPRETPQESLRQIPWNQGIPVSAELVRGLFSGPGQKGDESSDTGSAYPPAENQQADEPEFEA